VREKFYAPSKDEIAEHNARCADLGIPRYGPRHKVYNDEACTTRGHLDKSAIVKRTVRIKLDDQTTLLKNRYVSKALHENGRRVYDNMSPETKAKFKSMQFVKHPVTNKVVRRWQLAREKSKTLGRRIRGNERS
jgi:hypothetical protein